MPMHMNARSINAGNDTYRLTTKTWKEGAHVDWLEDAPTVAVGPDAALVHEHEVHLLYDLVRRLRRHPRPVRRHAMMVCREV